MVGPTLGFGSELSAPLGLTGLTMDERHKPSLKDAAQGFESVFLSMLLKEMRQTLEPGSMFGNDGGEIYGGMFDQFMSQHLSQGKGMGLAQALLKQLEPKATHGASHSASAPPTSGAHPHALRGAF